MVFCRFVIRATWCILRSWRLLFHQYTLRHAPGNKSQPCPPTFELQKAGNVFCKLAIDMPLRNRLKSCCSSCENPSGNPASKIMSADAEHHVRGIARAYECTAMPPTHAARACRIEWQRTTCSTTTTHVVLNGCAEIALVTQKPSGLENTCKNSFISSQIK